MGNESHPGHEALIVVDVQRDFLPDGALAVPGGDAVIAPLNALMAGFAAAEGTIVLTRDWHPADHCSFVDRAGPWPPHCVAGTLGAEFPAALAAPAGALHVSKGTSRDEEAYSGFQGTKLRAELEARGVRRLLIGGLATDYCVRATVLDALAAGFEVSVATDAVRAVDLAPGDGQRALEEMRAAGAVLTRSDQWLGAGRDPARSVLMTDLYQLTMLSAYFELGMEQTAVFEFFVRRLPVERGFMVAAGLAQALDYLETLHFDAGALGFLARDGRFKPEALRRFAALRFTGDVDAMPEGSVFFGEEPILRVTAPLPEAQLVESRLINLLNFQTMIASKAARCRLAAGEAQLVDFGMRRAHGAEAALHAARACYLAGFAATATVEAGLRFGIPLTGTMAHSFVLAHEDEATAFADFARIHPQGLTLLIDTYDTVAAARKVVELARRGLHVAAVRLDSGDLATLSREVRAVLDDGGLARTRIVASGNLDEYEIEALRAAGAPIDAFGVGTRLGTSVDAPYLDCVYKLQEYAGTPRRKRSTGKATWPGRKQVYRSVDGAGLLSGDVLGLVDENLPGRALLQPVMRGGRRLRPDPSLEELRRHASAELATLPPDTRRITGPRQVEVLMSAALRDIAARFDREHP